MILLALLACSSAPEAPPPPPKPVPVWQSTVLELPGELSAQLLAVRMATGRARRSPLDACEAVSTALQTAPPLQAHLAATRARLEDTSAFDEEVLALSEAIPGLRIKPESTEVDYTELGTAIGRTSEGSALISAGAILDYRAPWRKGSCVDLKAALPWLSRIGPTFKAADPCLSDATLTPITAVVQAWIDQPCWCGTEEQTLLAETKLAHRLKDTPQLLPLLPALSQAAKSGHYTCEQPG